MDREMSNEITGYIVAKGVENTIKHTVLRCYGYGDDESGENHSLCMSLVQRARKTSAPNK